MWVRSDWVLMSVVIMAIGIVVRELHAMRSEDDPRVLARQPLDLPSGGGRADDEEDTAEAIHFYGAEYEGDAFFWCLDKSGSM